MITEFDLMCVRQHKAHTKTFTNGDKLFNLGHGLYDLFCGKGWSVPARFRMVHLKQNNTYSLIQVSGPVLSREYRTMLYKELVH